MSPPPSRAPSPSPPLPRAHSGLSGLTRLGARVGALAALTLAACSGGHARARASAAGAGPSGATTTSAVGPSSPSSVSSAPSVGPAASSGPAAPPPLEPSSEAPVRLFDRAVRFLATGEEGRLAVLTVEDGALVPHRYEKGAWQRLALPAAHRASEADVLGVYFGRDGRPRAMGYRRDARKMIYLRYRDGRWQDQRSELGALAGDDAHLFGVLGEADPEVVCRDGKLCLFKSRKGWQEAKPTIPADAVVRVFSGRGYALSAAGFWRTAASGFERVGPAGQGIPWTTPATGLWVAPDGAAVVVEPARSLVHELDPGASAWRSSPSPLAGARDVTGPAERRVFVGDGGAARFEACQRLENQPCERGRTRRLGAASLRLSRAIEADGRVVMGGESGVFSVAATP